MPGFSYPTRPSDDPSHYSNDPSHPFNDPSHPFNAPRESRPPFDPYQSHVDAHGRRNAVDYGRPTFALMQRPNNNHGSSNVQTLTSNGVGTQSNAGENQGSSAPAVHHGLNGSSANANSNGASSSLQNGTSHGQQNGQQH